MPWTAPSGNKYSLCLLDTNILSEIIKNSTIEGRNFIDKYSASSHVPCLTLYNIIELRRHPELFDAYCELFSLYSHFLLKPYRLIWQLEVQRVGKLKPDSILMNSFSYLGSNPSHDVATFFTQIFEDPIIAEFEKNWRSNENDTLYYWLESRRNFLPSMKDANAKDAERYLKESGLQTLISIDIEWAKNEIELGNVPSVERYPSMKVMLYSQYYRIHNPHWKPKPQEVTDVSIIAASPYVDIVLTENFQAEINPRCT
jgi:hypothetical protein